MSRPGVGNPGNRGGGRKGAYVEQANAKFLADFFFKKHTRTEIRQMIEGETPHSVSDTMLAKAYAGDEACMLAVFKKLFPDTLKMDANIEGNFGVRMLTDAQLEKLANLGKKEKTK